MFAYSATVVLQRESQNFFHGNMGLLAGYFLVLDHQSSAAIWAATFNKHSTGDRRREAKTKSVLIAAVHVRGPSPFKNSPRNTCNT